MSWFSNPFRDSSGHDADHQENCVKMATIEGGTSALLWTAIGTVVVLGACKAFPKFNRSLSVSAKTALIVTPAFGMFFLKGELAMNECAQHKKHLLLAQQRAKAAAAATAAASA